MNMSVSSPYSRTLTPFATDTKQARSHPVNKMERIEVDAAPEAAVLEIRTRNPDMIPDWDTVWRERGQLKPADQIREIKAIAQERYARNISLRVEAGLRARNLHEEKGNVFGRIAFDKFIASRQKSIELVAVPKFGLRIDIRIYPPEIKVETNHKWDGD